MNLLCKAVNVFRNHFDSGWRLNYEHALMTLAEIGSVDAYTVDADPALVHVMHDPVSPLAQSANATAYVHESSVVLWQFLQERLVLSQRSDRVELDTHKRFEQINLALVIVRDEVVNHETHLAPLAVDKECNDVLDQFI